MVLISQWSKVTNDRFIKWLHYQYNSDVHLSGPSSARDQRNIPPVPHLDESNYQSAEQSLIRKIFPKNSFYLLQNHQLIPAS